LKNYNMIQQIEHCYNICMTQIQHEYDTSNKVSIYLRLINIYINIYIYIIYLIMINDELN